MPQVRIYGENKITITRSATRNYFTFILFGGIIAFLFYKLLMARIESDSDTVIRKSTDISVIILVFGIVILLLKVMEFNIRKTFESIELKDNIFYLNNKPLFSVNEITTMELKHYSPFWTRTNFYKIYIYSGEKGELILEKENERTAREVLGHLHAMLKTPWIETI